MSTINVREIFDYDPETGFLRWKVQPGYPKQWNKRYAGQVAGAQRPADGVFQVVMRGRMYQVARLIWQWVHGEVAPGMEIDHINGQPWDNRLVNLRLATRGQNRQNSRARGDWPKGVYRNSRGLFQAQIKYGGVNHYLGCFSTPEEACAVYKKEADRVFGEFACAWR